MLLRLIKLVSLSILLLGALPGSALEPPERLVRATPDGGVQPRLITAADGSVHLLYFKTRLSRPDAREGNLFYRRWDQQRGDFGLPVRVNSEGLALQTFAIARAAAALGGDGRLHVIWYVPGENQYFYARSNPERDAFEPQRAMISEFARGLDAGADIAAIGDKVALVWGAGDLSREYERTVFARLSLDSGASWGDELAVGDRGLGACACCSPAVEFENEDKLVIAYRSAVDGVGRHTQILSLQGIGERIEGGAYAPVFNEQSWEASFCPLSTNDALRSDDGLALVFETRNRIMFSQAPFDSAPVPVAEPFSETRQKNPALARDEQGYTLVAWGEGISHSRGGRLNMALMDGSGQRVGPDFEDELEIPRYSFPAAATLPDGRFLVLY